MEMVPVTDATAVADVAPQQAIGSSTGLSGTPIADAVHHKIDTSASNMKVERSGIALLLYQIRLLVWKRYCESTKTKSDLLKVFAPAILFFVLLILLYEAFGVFAAGGLEPFFVPVAFWLFIQRLVVQIMFEKSAKLQESMRMMGLYDVAYWISYFLADGVVLGFAVSFICAIISTGGLFNDANFGVVLGMLFVFCLAAVSFSFFLTSFFDAPQSAAQFTLASLLGMYVVYIVIFPAGKSTIDFHEAQIVCCFVPPLALQIASGAFLKSYDGIPLSTICGILVADIFIYGLLAWYFSEVWPSSVGVRKPFYFLFMPSYWFPKSIAANHTDACLTPGSKIDVEEQNAASSIPEEPANERLLGPPVVVVNKLMKTFGTQKAVNELSFKMYENQIFCLLGHNGAGKTTAISVLTGMIPPDYGGDNVATIYGKSIVTDMASIRFSLGVCPQHDVLFESLTVREHILFFAQLKGFTLEQAEAEAIELTNLFHLENRLDHLGNELSGGQRRKLSVAIAVCGGSKLVILDEPTAGMDPLARRELWDLLSALRKGRTILLISHYLDEADTLGDRVGIMSLGQMQCLGSPQFLKTTYGSGYKLIFDKATTMDSEKLAALSEFIYKHIPTARYVEEEATKNLAVYNLPFDTVDQFGKLFSTLEAGISHMHVNNFNLSITTLEDVFLKVGEDHTVTPHTKNVVGIGSDRQYTFDFFSQVVGLVRRKFIYSCNDFTTIPLLALPIAAIVAGSVLYNLRIISSWLFITDMAIGAIYIAGYLGAAGFIAEFIVRERADKLRNVLTVMGCSFKAYWLGTFIADLMLMSIPLFVWWITWAGAEVEHYYASKNGLCFFLTLLFTIHLISFSYFFSFVFTTPKSCISFMPMVIILLLILPNIVLLIIIQIATAVGTEIKGTVQSSVLLWGTMMLSPHGALFCCLLNVVNDYSSLASVLPNIGTCIAFMLVESALFLLYAYHTDAQMVAKLQPTEDPSFDPAVLDDLEEDVLKEREATLNSPDPDAPLVISRLRKVFPAKVVGRTSVVACEDLAFTVRKGEVLGLLGANGAGKTTILSMLTRMVVPTSGDATVAKHSILSDFTRGAKHLGVVTQNNSLWDKMSVEDHLYLFARLRGVPRDLVPQIVDGTIDQLELAPHRKKLSMSLSGGMKRKLCVAIALIGDPEVVLLDEPSAGLDPVSRRNLWNVILRTMSNRSLIITTHSMEEAEFLATNIGIMVRGQLRALGTKQHLKSKYGSGFELTIKLRVHDFGVQMDQINNFIRDMFPSAFIMIENGGLLTYQIPREEMSIGLVFTKLEKHKEELHIEDYTVAQPTLEQVFIRTVNKHTPVAQPNALPGVHEKIVHEKNKCGCTDRLVKILIAITFLLFVGTWLIAIFAVKNEQVRGALFTIGFIFAIAAVICVFLLCCACCKPPKGGNE